jgi:hypothetical protein
VSAVELEHKALEFLVAEPPLTHRTIKGDPPKCGFTWLIESSRTSFYIKPLVDAWGFAKVSLHGPDPNEDAPHNRLDFVSKVDLIAKAMKSGARWSPDLTVDGPMYFEGRPVNRRAKHVVRFRTSWELFTVGAPSGPPPVLREKATQKKRIDPPRRFRVLYIDIYVSGVRPYWPGGEHAARTSERFLGPMVNEAGQFLTGVAEVRNQFAEPNPFSDERGGLPADACYRDLGYMVADDGVLWICEMLSSPGRRVGTILWPLRRLT